MGGTEILNLFGFEVEEQPISIYPYSPVYRVKYGDRGCRKTNTKKGSKCHFLYDHAER